jgi:hypothetical protein
MSSLRLALKQSLQESGGGLPEKRKQKKRPPGQQQQRRKRRPGDPPRKRGRPRKHPLPEDVPAGGDANESAKESSDEENEFSDSMASMEHDDDDDDEDGEEGREGDDADDDGTTKDGGGDQEQQSQKQPEQEEEQQQRKQSRERASGDEDEEQQLRLARKKRKRLLKKMKRESAANTIQNQWKKKKKKKKKAGKSPPSNDGNNGNHSRPVSPQPPKKQEESEEQKQPEAAEESENATPAATPESTPVSKPKKSVNKTVPPPAIEIIDWIGTMSVKQQRRNMSAGLRVKVRFATKVKKRDGKIVRKHKWYGGLVTAMSSGGSKIRIKYDDGTSEIAKYPDKDIIVDDEDNDVHQADADAFMPPPPESDDDAINKDSSMDLVDSPERKKKPKKISSDTPKLSGRDSPDDGENRAPSKARADTPQREHEHEMTDDTNDGNVSEGVAPAEEKFTEETTAKANPSADDETAEQEAKPVKVPGAAPAEEDSEAKDDEKRSKSPKPTNVSKRERDLSNSSDADYKPLNDNDDDHVDSRMDKDMDADDDDDDSSDDDDSPMEIIAQGTGGEAMSPPPAAPEVAEEAAAPDNNDDNNAIMAAEEEEPAEEPAEKEGAIAQSEDQPLSAAVGDDVEEKALPEKAEVEENIVEEAPNADDDPTDKEEEAQVQPENDDEDTEKAIPVVEEEEQDPEDIGMEAVEEAPKVEEENHGANLSNEPSEEPAKPQKRKRESSPKPFRSNTPVLKLAKRETPPVPVLAEFKNDAPDTAVAKPIVTVAKSISLDADEARPPQEEEPRIVESAKIMSSEHSAFDKSDKALSMEKKVKPTPVQQLSNEDTRALTPTLDKTDLTNIQRSGRRAAQQANERIASRQELVIQDAFTKPKKKKGEKPEGKNAPVRDRKRKEPEGGIDITDDDNQWVQCDTCSKWRVLPSTVDVDKLPNQWHCEMNIYDPLHNICDAAEQTPEEIAKAKRKAKRRLARRAQKEAAAATAVPDAEGEVKEKEPKPSRRAKSPMPEAEKRDSKPKKEEKRPEEGKEGKKRSSPTTGSDEEGVNSSGSNSGSDQIKEAKKARRSRSQEDEAEIVEAPKGKPRGRRRGKEGKDKEGKGGKGSKSVEDNQEWVQCEKCEKWRRLPPQINASDLPDVWYCSMNTWDASTNTCGAAEDKADPNTVAVGGFGGHGGHKLSYRSLIFGTGKKQNRPISERTRAAESLFSSHAYGDELGSHPRVMYANSSMFVSRSTARASEESEVGRISFLDLMSQSNLWAELRGLGKRLNEQGTQAPSRLRSLGTDLSYPSLPDDLKREMKELVYHALGGSTMASHEVLLEAQCRPWEGVPKVWTELKAACTVDSVVACLLELVSDGRVEVAPATGAEVSVLEAMPKFRRVVKSPQVPQLEPEEEDAVPPPVKTSRCMKISKPWKRNISMDI